MSGCGCEFTAKNNLERKTLITVLVINALMFVFELAFGLIAQSTGLIADSLDMFADAIVYSISIYATGKAMSIKTQAAKLSGIVQIILALMVLADVCRRFFVGSEPKSVLMIIIATIALIANTICLKLISKHRDGDVNMRASVIFSKNDVIANLGVVIAGILVWVLNNRYPDLVIGVIISIVIFRGGILIICDAYRTAKNCL